MLHRAEALASVMAGRRAVAVAGTHGKTTTTSMLTVALQHCGADPSFAIGGNLNESGANAHNGVRRRVRRRGRRERRLVPAATRRPPRSSPTSSRTTSTTTARRGGRGGVSGVPRAGAARRLPRRVRRRPGRRALAEYGRAAAYDVRTYGEAPTPTCGSSDLVITAARATVRRRAPRPPARRHRAALPGRHNALNAAAALSAGLGLGLPWADLREGLAGFTGTRRRFELKGTGRGVRVFDNYAHHPTELRRRPDRRPARRGGGPAGRRVPAAPLQPHRGVSQEFGHALGLADEVVVMEVYAAREDPVPGVSGALVAAAVPLPPARVVFEPSWSAVAGELAERARPGDVVMTSAPAT